MKKLGFGLMRLPRIDGKENGPIDVEQVKKMVDAFIDKGFTYFDTAWMYCDFQSEETAKAALVDRYPRDRFTLATKLHSAFFNSLEDRDKVFNSQLSKTGVSYFDYYLLHGIDAGSLKKYDQYDCFNWIKEKKDKGLIKHMGFSFHDNAELLEEILTKHPKMDFVQLQINYLDWENDWIQSRKCYEVAVKHGLKIIVMEPVKGGTLAKVPEVVNKMFKGYAPDSSASSWAIRFAASLDNVMVVLSGMNTYDQLLDNTSYMQEFKPLNDEEKKIVERSAQIIKSSITIPCTGCSYCTNGCPMHIAIPQYFSLYNGDMQEAEGKGWTPNGTYYRQLNESFGKASGCIECGQCEGVCPQHLPIIQNLKHVAEHFEK